jgi:hypothetical protein
VKGSSESGRDWSVTDLRSSDGAPTLVKFAALIISELQTRESEIAEARAALHRSLRRWDDRHEQLPQPGPHPAVEALQDALTEIVTTRTVPAEITFDDEGMPSIRWGEPASPGDRARARLAGEAMG